MPGISQSNKVEQMRNMLEIDKSKRKPPRSRYHNNKDIDSTISAETVNTDILGALGARSSSRPTPIRRLTKK